MLCFTHKILFTSWWNSQNSCGDHRFKCMHIGNPTTKTVYNNVKTIREFI